MFKITFKYCDQYTNGKWNTQTCIVGSVPECIRIYGLGIDCDYEIVSVEKIKD